VRDASRVVQIGVEELHELAGHGVAPDSEPTPGVVVESDVMSAEVERASEGPGGRVLERLSASLDHPSVSVVDVRHLPGAVESPADRVHDERARLVVVTRSDDVGVGVVAVAPRRLTTHVDLRHITVDVVHSLVGTQVARSNLQSSTIADSLDNPCHKNYSTTPHIRRNQKVLSANLPAPIG